MSALRATFAGMVSAAYVFTQLTVSGCGTDAEGIEDCRKIEKARCTAGKICGIVSDVEECERFYRDQCLHGLSTKSPGAPLVDRCVQTVRAAGECAKAGRDTELASCPGVTQSAPGITRVCDVVISPEKTTECNFLAPSATPPSNTGGAAGAAGTTGTAGTPGTAGTGGTPGSAGAAAAGAGGADGAAGGAGAAGAGGAASAGAAGSG